MSHPLQQFYDHLGAGGTYSPTEVDEIAHKVADNTEESAMPFATLRRRLAEDAKKVVELHEEGSMGAARAHAREAKAELVALFEGFVQPADPTKQTMDVSELAAMIPRQ